MNAPEVLRGIRDTKVLSDEAKAQLKNQVVAFKETFVASLNQIYKGAAAAGLCATATSVWAGVTAQPEASAANDGRHDKPKYGHTAPCLLR